MDLLIFLIGRRGELVTREQIGAALWETSTFVDREHGINSAVRKIRAALHDNAASPQYIETIARRGYRFVAPVTIEAKEPAESGIVPEADTSPPPAPRRRFPHFRLAPAGIALAVLLAAALLASIGARRALPDSPPALEWKPITKAVHLMSKIASDGRNVFWTEIDESGCRPWEAPLDGGADASAVRIPFSNAWVMDATPEGQLLIVVKDTCISADAKGLQGPFWEVTLASGKTRRVGDLSGQDAAWSPDARRIAFVRWNELWLANRDGSGSRRIAALPGPIATEIHWSPDSKCLRFSVQPNTEYRSSLWEVEAETGKARPLLPEWTEGSERGGAWTPAGAFVFDAERPSGSDLWWLAPGRWPSGGRQIQQVTRGPLDFSGPINIPGRTELAVVGARKQGELESFDSTSRRFVPFLNGISAEMADFSRDGKWVVYVTFPERDLWRSRVDGAETLQLTHGPLRTAMPRISPDTRQVAFTGDFSGKEMRTWLVPFNGGEPRPATQLLKGTAEVAPTWSPDSSKLLFRLDRAVQRNVLQILDLSSHKIENVPDSEQKFNQRWSPDGRWIAATPNDEKSLEVYNLQRREWTTLTQMRADYPNWSRNSNYLYYCTRFENGEEAIYRVSVTSRKTELITSLLATRRAFDEIYNQWVGLSPGDSPLILRSADLQQIYLLSFAGR